MDERFYWKIYLSLSQNMFFLSCIIILVRYKSIGIDYNYKKICHQMHFSRTPWRRKSQLNRSDIDQLSRFAPLVRANAIEKIFREMESHSLWLLQTNPRFTNVPFSLWKYFQWEYALCTIYFRRILTESLNRFWLNTIIDFNRIHIASINKLAKSYKNKVSSIILNYTLHSAAAIFIKYWL